MSSYAPGHLVTSSAKWICSSPTRIARSPLDRPSVAGISLALLVSKRTGWRLGGRAVLDGKTTFILQRVRIPHSPP